MSDEQGPWIDTNPGPRTKRQFVLQVCKRLRVFVGSHIFHQNASKPVKVCHIFHADIVKLCQMHSANVSIYTSKFN